MKKKIINILLGSSILTIGNVYAAGFALIEQNASGMGNAYAGAAAVAEDASTIFFNPAGMTYIDGTQAVGAVHFIKPRTSFDNDGSIAANGGRPLGDDGPDAGDLAIVPNFYWMTAINPSVKVGVGVNVPFGLKTEYDDEWLGRFQADKSELKTININPSIAFKLNEKFSLGLGVSAMRAEATLTRSVNFGPFGEGAVKVEGDDWGFGYNLGLIYQVTNNTRLGFAYRSEVKQKLDGDAKFDRPAGLPAPFLAATADGKVKAKVDLPASFSVSAFSQINSKWDLMGDVTWTEWSNFEELRVVRDSGATLTVTPENWHNTMRYSVGVNYHYSDILKLRAGIAYDEEAIKTEYRTPRIPGNDRKWLSLGASYKISDMSIIDIGYSHLFISNTKIDDDQTAVSPTSPFNNGRVRGDYEASVDILSLQFTHNF